jgi:hypothetical protein
MIVYILDMIWKDAVVTYRGTGLYFVVLILTALRASYSCRPKFFSEHESIPPGKYKNSANEKELLAIYVAIPRVS